MFFYRFADILIASELPLSELPLGAPQACYRITATEDCRPPAGLADARHDWLDGAGAITLTGLQVGASHYLVAPGLLATRIDRTCLSICIEPDAAPADARHTLLNQILPRVLDRDGELMLHAALVADAGKPGILLLGESRYGKSTLSAACAQAGARLLSDDGVRVVLSNERVAAIATYPSLCLRPDSHAALYGGELPAARMRVSGVAASPQAPAAVELGAIVVLNAPGADIGITLQRMAPGDAAIAVVGNSFAFDPADVHRARQRLAQAARVASTVPAYRLGYPRDYACLPEVVAHLRSVRP